MEVLLRTKEKERKRRDRVGQKLEMGMELGTEMETEMGNHYNSGGNNWKQYSSGNGNGKVHRKFIV